MPGSPNSLASSRISSLPATTVQTFTYDAAGRLIQEDRTGSASTVWTYDDAGNRTAQSTGTNTTTYSYDADNRLLSQTNGSVVTSFTYDANGSMTGRSSPGETLAYAWDTAGRLSSITRNGTTQASFTYDGDGNRRSKTSGATTTAYVNDARGLSQVLQAITGTKTVSYVGNAQYDSSRPTKTEKWGYTLSDAQNSRLLLDNAGALAHRWEWEPFGRARADTGATPAAFTFGGEERDDETGLINLRARYYDPAIGRFLSRDSLPGSITLPQSWNRFSYVENDPINALDPSGHKKRTKIKWPNGQDPDDDDDRRRKKAKACKNPGQYTGSCKGGPPNAAYAADGEAQYEAKKAGQAAAAGYLAAAQAHLSSAQYFASVAGTAAALTAALQAEASIAAAQQSIRSAQVVDSPNAPRVGRSSEMLIACTGVECAAFLPYSVPGPSAASCQCDGDLVAGNTAADISDDGNDCTEDGLYAGIVKMTCVDTFVETLQSGTIKTQSGMLLPITISVPMMSPGDSGGGDRSGGSGRKRREWELDDNQASRILQDRNGRKYLQHKETGLWWTKDSAHHGRDDPSMFKVYEQKGNRLEWVADANRYGRYLENKHKGDIGLFIPLKDLHGVK